MSKGRHTFRYILFKALLALLLTGIALGVRLLCRENQAFATDKLRPLAGRIVAFLSSLFSFVPFSCAEILLYTLILLVLISLIVTVARLITRGGKLRRLLSWLSSLALLASVLFLVFEMLFGGLYYAESRMVPMGLTVKKRPVSELETLCMRLAGDANEYADAWEYEAVPPDLAVFAHFADDVTAIVSERTGTEQAKPKYVIAVKK